VGIVGTGTIAAAHAAAVNLHSDAQLVSVYDLDPDRARDFAASCGLADPASTLSELVLDPAVDAVLVCTPPGAHAGTTVAALDAGVHVLCEKPLAMDVASAVAMVDAAERSSAFLACASSRLRCTPPQRTARRMIDGGELGEVYHVRCSSWRLRGRPGHHFATHAGWFLDSSQSGGGVLIDYGVYAIDAALALLGHPRIDSVLGQVRRVVEEPNDIPQDVEDHAAVMIQCEGGRSAVIEVAWVSNMTPSDSMIVLGTEAGLRFDPLTKIGVRAVGEDEHDPLRTLYHGTDSAPDRYWRATEEQLYPFAALATPDQHDVTRQFLDGVISGWQPETAGGEALQVLQVIEAAYRSAGLGRPVRIASAQPRDR
jgi:predicted dehydrogenase